MTQHSRSNLLPTDPKEFREPSVFLHSFEAVRDILMTTPTFPKPTRHTLGRRLDDTALDALEKVVLIVGASGIKKSDREGRLKALNDISRGIDLLRFLLRLSRDLGAISAGKNAALSERFDEIGREIGGMIKALTA